MRIPHACSLFDPVAEIFFDFVFVWGFSFPVFLQLLKKLKKKIEMKHITYNIYNK